MKMENTDTRTSKSPNSSSSSRNPSVTTSVSGKSKRKIENSPPPILSNSTNENSTKNVSTKVCCEIYN